MMTCRLVAGVQVHVQCMELNGRSSRHLGRRPSNN